jgi:hypothetical protein
MFLFCCLSLQLSSPNLDIYIPPPVYHSSETVWQKFSYCVSLLNTCSSFTWYSFVYSHLSKALRMLFGIKLCFPLCLFLARKMVVCGYCSLLLACLVNFSVLGAVLLLAFSITSHPPPPSIVLGMPRIETGCSHTCLIHRLFVPLVQLFLLGGSIWNCMQHLLHSGCKHAQWNQITKWVSFLRTYEQ